MWFFGKKSNADKLDDADKAGRIADWRNGRIKKEFNLHLRGGGMDPFWSPPPETQKLPDGWSIDHNGHFTCHLPEIRPTDDDFADGERKAFPAYMTAARMSKDTSSTRFLMSADKVAMKFHHWMGDNVPGFWDVYNYKRSQHSDKVFRLVIEDVADITLYSTHGGYNGNHAKTDEEGALMVVKTPDGKTHRLLYESNIANPHRDVCYPGHRDEVHVGFTLPPNDMVIDNLIAPFAMVRAIGRAAEEGRLSLKGANSLRQSRRIKRLKVAIDKKQP